jgi:PST family polysaccharide transporter
MSPIVLVFFPRMGALGKSDRTAAEMLAKNLLLIQGGCALALTLGLVVFAPLAVYLLLGAAFIDAVPVLRLQACLIFLVGVSNVLGLMIMLPFGMKKQFMHAIFAGAAVGAVSVVPLCYAFGACGAAASTVLAEAAVTLWMFVHLARQFSWLSLRNGHGRA